MWIEIAGWAGMGMMLLAYYLNSTGRAKNFPAIYQWMNFWAAIGIVINAYFKEAWAIMMLDVIWAGIALQSLFKLRKISYDALRASNS